MTVSTTMRLMGLLVIVGMVAGCGEATPTASDDQPDAVKGRFVGVYGARIMRNGEYLLDLRVDGTFTCTRRLFGSGNPAPVIDSGREKVTTWQSRGGWRVAGDDMIELTHTHKSYAWEGTDMSLLDRVPYGPLAEPRVVVAVLREDTLLYGTSADRNDYAFRLPRR